MSSAVEFVINLEDPCIDVKVVGNQLCELGAEGIKRVDVISSKWHWNIGQLKDSLSTRLGRENFSLCWFSSHYWNSEVHGELHVELMRSAWNDIALLSMDDLLDLVECHWRVEKSLSETQMLTEPCIVFGDDDVKALLRVFNLNKF